MARFRSESVLDRPSGKYKFVIYEGEDTDDVLYESDPDYDSHDDAEKAAVDLVRQTLASLH